MQKVVEANETNKRLLSTLESSQGSGVAVLNSLADHFNFLTPCPAFIYLFVAYLLLLFVCLGRGKRKAREAINLFNLKRLSQRLSLSMSKAVKENSVNKLNAPIQESVVNGTEA